MAHPRSGVWMLIPAPHTWDPFAFSVGLGSNKLLLARPSRDRSNDEGLTL